MSIVHAFPAPLNSHVVTADRIGVTVRAIGHADECTALLADPDTALTPGDMAEGLEEWDTDRAIQTADESHETEARKALSAVRELVGINVAVRISRSIGVASDRGVQTDWTALVSNENICAIGNGATPSLAVEALAAEIDRKAGIVPSFGGYRLPGVVLVTAGHDRTPAEALAHVRRVAINPTYLEVLLSFNVVGVVDERPTRPAAAAAA